MSTSVSDDDVREFVLAQIACKMLSAFSEDDLRAKGVDIDDLRRRASRLSPEFRRERRLWLGDVDEEP